MGVTRVADVDAQIREFWAADLYSQAERLTFWQRFEGPEGSSMPIVRRDDFEKEPGDTIKFDIVMALTGAGTTGDLVLTEGNEEEVKLRQISMGLTSLKHAVRWSWMSELMITHNMRVTALNQLRKWLAGKIDDMISATLTGETVNGFVPVLTAANLPTSMKKYANRQTATTDLDESADKLTLDSITDLKAYALQNNMLEPLRLDDGEEVFAMILHPYTARDLKLSDAWKQAQREAMLRGQGNPLFTGALGMWDNVILYQNPRIPTANDGAGSIAISRNVFLGTQAAVRGYALHPQWIEQEFSYGEEIGIATRLVLGQKLVTFDLNATETTGDSTDDTAIGAMIMYAPAVAH